MIINFCFKLASILQQVHMAFIAFELESHSSCGYDHLRIYNGATTASPVLGTFCGSIVPGDQITDGRDALLQFKSDGSVTTTGFELAFDRLETGKSDNHECLMLIII